LHSHTLFTYFRKKFMIGYWKAQILRRFPGRAVQDSHTPQVLKAQIMLLALILVTAVGTFLTPYSAIALTVTLMVFFASTIPFLLKAWSKDRVVTLAAPFLLAIRAAALGFGSAWGLIKAEPATGKEHTINGFNYVLKRTMDIIGGLIGLIVAVIASPIIALAIKLDTPGRVIFKQERVGEQGRPFTLYKFRSMHANTEGELAQMYDFDHLHELVYKRKDDPRLTHVGRVLRRWSLDELPQFWNVLTGDMSLVGPRPEESQYVALYDDWHRRRLAVKPGMTGPMQVKGRADLTLDARVQLDLDYIENYSLLRDVAILLETVPAVVRGEGAH
jgi:lipopolysaccharide/colanic/teichoic acid biosynthesis glycosyltransferase